MIGFSQLSQKYTKNEIFSRFHYYKIKFPILLPVKFFREKFKIWASQCRIACILTILGCEIIFDWSSFFERFIFQITKFLKFEKNHTFSDFFDNIQQIQNILFSWIYMVILHPIVCWKNETPYFIMPNYSGSKSGNKILYW